MTTGRRPGGTPPGSRSGGRRPALYAVRPPPPPPGPTEPLPAPPLEATLHAEDEVLAATRVRAAERAVGAVAPATAALWSFLAVAGGARSVVEVGTGVGVGSLALLRGMPADGLLTSIDVDADHQRLARAACTEAGYAPGRLRLITGRALEVLPRLSDAAYDLVVVDAATVEYPAYLAAAVRLLRPGGVVALDRMGGPGRVAGRGVTDPVRRDAVSVAVREATRLVRDDEHLVPILLPLADGVLCAARR